MTPVLLLRADWRLVLSPPSSPQEILALGEPHHNSRKSFAIFSLGLWIMQDNLRMGLWMAVCHSDGLVLHPQGGKIWLWTVFINIQETHYCRAWLAWLWLGIWAVRYKTSDRTPVVGIAVLFSILKSSLPLRVPREVRGPTDIFSHPLLQHQIELRVLKRRWQFYPILSGTSHGKKLTGRQISGKHMEIFTTLGAV